MFEKGNKIGRQFTKGHLYYPRSEKGKIPICAGKDIGEVGRKKLSESKIGELNPNWKGGITPLLWLIRRCPQNKQWVKCVFDRDNYTCQRCSIRGVKLESHHTKRFAVIFKEHGIHTLEDAIRCTELWDINNGITFCKECHKSTRGRPKIKEYCS